MSNLPPHLQLSQKILEFEDFDLSYDVLDGIHAMGFRTPTPIQQEAIPRVLDGKDLIACAQTGTGKTGAYLIPLIERMAEVEEHYIKCLILVPTRELALQIDQQVEGLGYYSHIRSIPVYGGNQGSVWEQQKRAIEKGVDIVIATPGRLMMHMNLGNLNFSRLEHLVLDEADKMLDMGFYDDIMKIERELPKNRQTLMFSATMPPKIRDMAQRILNQPEQITLSVSKPAEKIDQRAYLVHDTQKPALIQHILKTEPIQSMIMFISKKSEVDKVERMIRKMGFEARGIHSDKDQQEREEILRGFRNKSFPILIATDIMSRGIDIENISHILNYDVPGEGEDYVHRIGRTARAETDGVAITFINEEQLYRLRKIEKLIEKEVPRIALPEGFGPGPDPNAAGNDRRGGRGGNSRSSSNKGRGGFGGNPSGGGNRNPQPGKGNSRPVQEGKSATEVQTAGAEAGHKPAGKRRSRGGRNRGRGPKTQAPAAE